MFYKIKNRIQNFFDIKKATKPSSYIRYDYLVEYIKKHKCKNILEVGTWNGLNSTRMLNAACSQANSSSDINYWGFDLWELMNDDIFDKEYSKRPPKMAIVKERLKKLGCNINLYQGDTIDTLKQFKESNINKLNLDFIYIDGGHSFDTIESDWDNIKGFINANTQVIFDDYYIYTSPDPTANVGEDLQPTFGCSKLIDSLDRKIWNIKLLPNYDEFPPRKVYFVLVTKQ